MPRARYCVPRRARKKRLLKRAKGFFQGRRNLIRTVMETVLRADVYAYRDRRVKKRNFRKLWITRISAAVRQRGMSYSRFIEGLQKANVEVNRKMLSMMGIEDPKAFDQLVEIAKKQVA